MLDIMVIVVCLISAGIGWAIASSLLAQSRKKGFFYLIMLIAVILYSLVSLFRYSTTLGLVGLFIHAVFAVLTYLSVNKKRHLYR